MEDGCQPLVRVRLSIQVHQQGGKCHLRMMCDDILASRLFLPYLRRLPSGCPHFCLTYPRFSICRPPPTPRSPLTMSRCRPSCLPTPNASARPRRATPCARPTQARVSFVYMLVWPLAAFSHHFSFYSSRPHALFSPRISSLFPPGTKTIGLIVGGVLTGLALFGIIGFAVSRCRSDRQDYEPID